MMSPPNYWKVTTFAVALICGLFLSFRLFGQPSPPNLLYSSKSSSFVLHHGNMSDPSTYIKQRNDMSRMMNSLAQSNAIKECVLQKLQSARQTNPLSNSGGWCESPDHPYYHATDTELIPGLVQFFTGKRVASFGDGRGEYKKRIDRAGKLVCYDAYDGGPYSDLGSKGLVKYMDLAIPQYGLPIYDWIISLEVVEHIPAQFEDVYLDNVVRHAKDGIVLSWAVPGQPGIGHVNLKPVEDVFNKLRTLGFEVDHESSAKLQNAASMRHLQKNIYVYIRRDDVPFDENEI